MDEILDITLLVAGTFERLGIPYLVGGSLASSLHGIPRATQDADVVAGIEPTHVAHFVGAFGEAFYLNECSRWRGRASTSRTSGGSRSFVAWRGCSAGLWRRRRPHE